MIFKIKTSNLSAQTFGLLALLQLLLHSPNAACSQKGVLQRAELQDQVVSQGHFSAESPSL